MDVKEQITPWRVIDLLHFFTSLINAAVRVWSVRDKDGSQDVVEILSVGATALPPWQVNTAVDVQNIYTWLHKQHIYITEL